MSLVQSEIDDGADGEVLPSFSRSGAGYVYCLSNPAMPGLVKIGFTNRSTKTRVEELSFGRKDASATGVPLPFEIVKDWQVPADRAEEIEQHLHRLLPSLPRSVGLGPVCGPPGGWARWLLPFRRG